MSFTDYHFAIKGRLNQLLLWTALMMINWLRESSHCRCCKSHPTANQSIISFNYTRSPIRLANSPMFYSSKIFQCMVCMCSDNSICQPLLYRTLKCYHTIIQLTIYICSHVIYLHVHMTYHLNSTFIRILALILCCNIFAPTLELTQIIVTYVTSYHVSMYMHS